MFQPEQQISIYTLKKYLGKGAFGEVWLAESRKGGSVRDVAVKLPLNSTQVEDNILDEIINWVKAGRHPNILPFIEAKTYNGQVIIASEYAPDGSLHGYLNKRGGKLPVDEAVEMTIGILKGLEHLHTREDKIIHRDIKPGNVLLSGNVPRLADFGLSRVITESSDSSQIAGTVAFMSPDALDGKRNEQTDIWAVGVLLYLILKGAKPFPYDSETQYGRLVLAIYQDDPEPLPDYIPAELQNIVLKALAKNPAERYQTAAEMRQALQRFAGVPEQTEDELPTVEVIKLIPYRIGDKWGYCDSNRNIVIQPKYDNAYPFREGLARVEQNDKYGFIDKTGREIIALKYDYVDDFYEGLARVGLNLKYGFINKTGREITALKYDDTSYFREGLASVKLNNKYGFIDKTDREIIALKYDYVEDFSEGLAYVRLNDKYGFIDKTGREIVALKYDDVDDFREGLAHVYLNDEDFYIDKNGTEFYEP